MPISTATPRLRPELEPFAMNEGGRTVVVLADPASGRHFRLRAVEGTILGLLDGRRDLEEIRDEVERAFPSQPLPLDAVAAFIERAGQLGLLEGVRPVARRRGLIQSLLFLKISFLNPDRVLTRLYSRLAFVYRPWAIVLAALLVIVAAVVAMASWGELHRALTPPSTFAGMVLLWLSVSAITLIHELGHGLTCKHFGARATGFGLLFLYFLPCFFCDVSGAWTLPRRRERLWIGAAGLIFQIVAGAAALLVWRVVEPTSWVAHAAIGMVSVCGIDALLNLVPLIRLDGYYMLSDWLEIPNLRPRAMAHVGGRLRGLLLGLPGSEVAATPRQARIFLVYGTLAGLFVTGLLAWSALSLYRWLHGRFAGMGVLAFVIVLGSLLTPPLWRLVRLWASAVWGRPTTNDQRPTTNDRRLERDADDGPGPPSNSLVVGRWSLVGRSPRVRALVLAGLVPGAMAVLALAQADLNVVAPCRLEAVRSVPQRAARGGVLSELHYREGEWVRQGAVIGALDTFALQKELTALQAQEAMLRVEGEITARTVPLIAAERAGDAAEAAASVPRARVAVQDAGEGQRYRLSESRDRVAEAEAVLLAAEQKAARLRAETERAARGDYPPALEALRGRIEAVRIEAHLAETDLARVSLLVKEGAVAQQTVDVTRARLQSLQTREEEAVHELLASEKRLRDEAEDAAAEVARTRAAYRVAQGAYRLVEQQASPQRLVAAQEELRARKGVVRAAESRRQEATLKLAEGRLRQLDRERVGAQIALAQRRMAQSQIVAKESGVIATPRLEQRLGRQFAAGEAVCVLDLTRQLQVRVFVDERDVAEVRRGAPVQLKVAAFPEEKFEGEVREIVRRSLTANGRNSYEVRLRITNPGGRLMPGMTGWAKLRCGSRSWGSLLARRALRYVRTEAWSWF